MSKGAFPTRNEAIASFPSQVGTRTRSATAAVYLAGLNETKQTKKGKK